MIAILIIITISDSIIITLIVHYRFRRTAYKFYASDAVSVPVAK